MRFKRSITAIIAIAAVLFSSCANKGNDSALTEAETIAGLSETAQIQTETSAAKTNSEEITSTSLETEISVIETAEETVVSVASETTQTETAENNADELSPKALTGKWTEQNRLYTYEFDESGKVTIDTASCRISGRYMLDGEYDLILYLDWQGEYEGDEPIPYGFDLKKTENGYIMNYHSMDEGGYMPFEPITLVSGFASALWSDEPIVLTEYKESPIVHQKDVLGLWSIDADDLILLFTEENTYIASDGELYPQYDSIIKDGTWDIDGETAYLSSNGEKVAISTLYETKIMTKWDPDELPITGVFIIKNGDKEIAELWLKNGIGIVSSDTSSAAASVSIDGGNITIKMGDKSISGIFCPSKNGSYPEHDKYGYYKDGKLPCSYYVFAEDEEIVMEFDILTLYNSRFNEWYNTNSKPFYRQILG